MLPDFDGLEVTRRLRARGVHTPILFLAARDAITIQTAIERLRVARTSCVSRWRT